VKISVLIYSHDWFPQVGGIQTVTLSLATGLTDWAKKHPGESIEVIFVTQTPANSMDDSQFPFRVRRRPGNRDLFRYIRTVDVIQVEGPSMLPLVFGWLLRKPVILRHHGYQSICPNGLLLFGPDASVCPGYFMARRYHKCFECNSREYGWFGSLRKLALTFPRRWLARRATANIGVSPHVADRVALPRTQVIWNGVKQQSTLAIDAAHSVPGPAQEQRPPCFAYLGRLVAEKGVHVLLRACRELADQKIDFRLKIVGDGPQRRILEYLANELNLAEQTEFTGSIPATEIAAVLKGVIAVIMPSTCEDVSPLVAIEQMMQSRLLIVSDIGGLGGMVDGVGLKFPSGDAKALAACMHQAIENPAHAAELAAKGQKRASERFTEDEMVSEHIRLYKELARP
jgi:glycosyltransferase involved in cell wall biosynthesis